jgi:sugar/nucleoside kinase (ribokinase family)
MKYDIITVGGSVEDVTFYTKEGVLLDNRTKLLKQKVLAFEYGAKIKIDSIFLSFGGGAANAAVNFSRLGLKSAVLTAVGDDERGRKIIANFKKQKVATGLVRTIKHKESGFSFILVGQNHEHIVFSDRGANNELKLTAKDIKIMESAKSIYLASLSGPSWEDTLKKVFSVKGPKIYWNPGHIQLSSFKKISKYLKQTEILFVNKDEALELALSAAAVLPGFIKTEFDNNKKLALALKNLGPHAVVITAGKQGADAYNGHHFYRQPVLKEKKRVDTTGVGDAFNSSVVAGMMLYKNNWPKAMYLGAASSASLISEPGAQNGLLKKSDLKKLKFKN